MPHRNHLPLVALAAASTLLAGCYGPGLAYSPPPSLDSSSPSTVVEKSQLAPSASNDPTYGGANMNIPGLEEEETCED